MGGRGGDGEREGKGGKVGRKRWGGRREGGEEERREGGEEERTRKKEEEGMCMGGRVRDVGDEGMCMWRGEWM